MLYVLCSSGDDHSIIMCCWYFSFLLAKFVVFFGFIQLYCVSFINDLCSIEMVLGVSFDMKKIYDGQVIQPSP